MGIKVLQKLCHVCGDMRWEKKENLHVSRDVPAGCLAVYVGEERRRFVIKVKILEHKRFRVLLDKSAEEFEYKHDGGLIIPCGVAFFEHQLHLMKTN